MHRLLWWVLLRCGLQPRRGHGAQPAAVAALSGVPEVVFGHDEVAGVGLVTQRAAKCRVVAITLGIRVQGDGMRFPAVVADGETRLCRCLCFSLPTDVHGGILQVEYCYYIIIVDSCQ